MSVNLTKGQNVQLAKVAPGLNKVRVALGWNANNTSTGSAYDLDVTMFACKYDANGDPKVPNDDYMLFYGSATRTRDNGVTTVNDGNRSGLPAIPGGAAYHTGDNLTGAGDGDDETIVVDLARVSADATLGSGAELKFVVSIYDAAARKQNFGQVTKSYIRLVDDVTGAEVARYDLADDFSTETSVEFGSLYQKNGEWRFKAFGQGHNAGLDVFARQVGVNVA